MIPSVKTWKLAVPALVVATMVVLGVAFDWAWLPPLGRWLDGFVRTAGFGAMAGLAAAVIAYRGVTSRISVDRQLEERRRADAVESADRTRRWEMLMWVYNHIDDETSDPDRMLDICSALMAEMSTDLELAMLATILRERLNEEDQTQEEVGG